MFRFIILLCFHIFTSVYTFSSQNSFNSRLTSSDHNSSLQENRNQSVVIEISEINSANQSALHSQTETQRILPTSQEPILSARLTQRGTQESSILREEGNPPQVMISTMSPEHLNQLTQLLQHYTHYEELCVLALSDLNSHLPSLEAPHSFLQYLRDLLSSYYSLAILHSNLPSLNAIYLDLQSFIDLSSSQSSNNPDDRSQQSSNSLSPPNLQHLRESLLNFQSQANLYSCFLFHDFCYRIMAPIGTIGAILLILYVYDTPDSFAS